MSGQSGTVSGSLAQPTVAQEHAISRVAVFILALVALDFGLEAAIIVPAIPALAREYDASLISVSWLITGFMLAAIVAYPMMGRFGDLFGQRRLILISLALFAVGSLLCAVAGSIEFAIAGRVIQGLGAGIGPLTLGLARDMLPGRLWSPRAAGVDAAGER